MDLLRPLDRLFARLMACLHTDPRPLELSEPRSVYQGGWASPRRLRQPGGFAREPRDPLAVLINRRLGGPIRGLALLLALVAPAAAFPPASSFVGPGENPLRQVVRAAYYAAHGEADTFEAWAVHASTSDRLDLAPTIATVEQRRRLADYALHCPAFARAVLDAHYYAD